MDSLHLGSDAVLWVGITIIGYFLRDLIRSNKEQHRSTALALQQIAGRIKSDDEILGIVNGKYVSRRENELMVKESDHAHANITENLVRTHANIAENLAATNKELTTLREHWHGAIAGLLSKISTQLERR